MQDSDDLATLTRWWRVSRKRSSSISSSLRGARSTCPPSDATGHHAPSIILLIVIGTIIEVTDAQVQFSQADLKFVQALYDYRVFEAKLDKAIGKPY
mgnify:CR=1 FL=1